MEIKNLDWYVKQTIINCVCVCVCVSTYMNVWRDIWKSWGIQGHFLLSGPVSYSREHWTSLEPFRKSHFPHQWDNPKQLKKQKRIMLGDNVNLTENCHIKSLSKDSAFSFFTLSTLVINFSLALFSDRLKVPLVQGWLDSFTIVSSLFGTMPNLSKAFKNYLLNEQKDRGSTLGSIYSYLSQWRGLEGILDWSTQFARTGV